MNKKLIIGALALTATATFGLAGCGDDKKKNEEQKTPTYTVTFDHDNNPETDNQVVEYQQGDTSLANIPEVPELNGFAGVWDSFVLNNQNITVTAKYGDGTATNPYLVATKDQFYRILNDFYTQHTTIFANAEEQEVEEAEALTKTEIYGINTPTVKVTYTRDGVSQAWSNKTIEVLNKVYFKLIADIDISTLGEESVSGEYFAGDIDGNNKSLLNFSGDKFKNGGGAIFKNVVDGSIKNLNITLGENLGSLFGNVIQGTNRLENITISNANTQTFLGADDSNKSPFVSNVLNNATLTFESCANNADFVSIASSFGVFVGGYGAEGATINFNNCSNSGDITSSSQAGIFFGNGSSKPTYNIQNGVNMGTITSSQTSNILVPYISDEGFTAEEASSLNENNEINLGEIKTLTTEYSAMVNGNDVIITNLENLKAGKYELIISGLAQAYVNTDQPSSTMQISISTTIDVDGESNMAIFDSALYGMIDLNTYKSTFDLTDEDLADVERFNIEGYNIEYFVDKENGYYVVDFSNYDNIENNEVFVLNKTASEVDKVIVTRDANNNVVDFVLNYSDVSAETDIIALLDFMDQVGTTIEEESNNLIGINVILRSQPSLLIASYQGNIIDMEVSTINDYDGPDSGVSAYQYIASLDSVSVDEYNANPIKILCQVNEKYYSFDLTTDLIDKILSQFGM